MKKLLVPSLIALATMTLLTGCLNLQVGAGSKPQPSVGQQLMDLNACKATGIITETEYQAQKAKILGEK